jgi:Putative MetA-pathway of phenol degradation
MSRLGMLFLSAAWLFATAGCHGELLHRSFDSSENGVKAPKTLLEWAAAKEPENGKDEDKNKASGADEEQPMPHDRPHFADSSRTVGLGRVMLESGYTFLHDNQDGTKRVEHSYPEALLRVGVFAEWCELRLAWNYVNETQTTGGVRESSNGAEDLDVGVRLALTEQHQCLPETAVTMSLLAPTGSRPFTANRILPAFRYHYTWELVEDKLTLEGNTVAAAARDDSRHDYLELGQFVALEYTPTKKLELFIEWVTFAPHGAVDPTAAPQHYFHGGGTYLFTKDFGIDLHAAVGVNRHANDYFAGAGFVARY